MPIERLQPGEGARLKALRRASVVDSPDAFGATLQSIEERDLAGYEQQIHDLATFVAVEKGVDVGIVRGVPDEDDPGAGWLFSMWVSPDYRGHGVASQLIDVVVGWAREAGLKRLKLDVVDTNVAAIKLYERHGFLPTGFRCNYPPPREHIAEHRRCKNL